MIQLESRSGYECRFDLVDEISPQWFEEFVSVLRVYSASPEHDRSPVDCGARLVANPETRITFNSLDDWARYVRENWKDAAESDF